MTDPVPSGRLVAIAARTASRSPMELREEARVTRAGGIAGDTRGHPGPRQVTVLSAEAWKAVCAELGEELQWTLRRSNLLVEGLDLAGSAGGRLRLGDGVVLEITGETRPCQRMERHPGMRAALARDWRGGVTCRVEEGGVLRVGDPVVFETSPEVDFVTRESSSPPTS